MEKESYRSKKSTCKDADTVKYPAYVRHVRSIRTGAIPFWYQSGYCASDEWCGNTPFIFITKGKAPAYLGSSFAFLSPALLVISKYGYEYALGGFVVLGIAGMCVALIVRQCGTDWIDIVLPTAAMGPVVALIGLELAGNAASTAGLLDEKVDPKNVIVFLVTLGVAVFGQILFRGFLSVIPILIAIIAGYVAAGACGLLDFYTGKGSGIFGSSQLYISEI